MGIALFNDAIDGISPTSTNSMLSIVPVPAYRLETTGIKTISPEYITVLRSRMSGRLGG
jgi:hypothetical protein